MQENLFHTISSLLGPNHKLTEVISDILNVNYDAAYRRIIGKTKLSINEAVTLAKYFKISLNSLYNVGDENVIMATKSPELKNQEDLEKYFRESIANLQPIARSKSAEILYSAKDIPLFYTLKDSYLTRYKIYVWLKLVDEEMAKNRTSFDQFIHKIPDSLLKSAFELGETYNYISITEFWNDNTINGTIQQILYFFESGLLSRELALHICDDLADVVNYVEKQTIQQNIIGSKNKSTYNLYKSDLLTMSNTLMVKTPHKKVFFTPFTVLSYFKIEQVSTCDQMALFFEKQMMNSKLLVKAGEKDRTLFFNRMHQKIEVVKNRINLDRNLAFL
ncbi:MAG: hypothetical protein ACWA5P_04995 [bacterium]